jgi:hypothetical protein
MPCGRPGVRATAVSCVGPGFGWIALNRAERERRHAGDIRTGGADCTARQDSPTFHPSDDFVAVIQASAASNALCSSGIRSVNRWLLASMSTCRCGARAALSRSR